MKASKISDLFDELGRCELSPFNDTLRVEQHTYNDFTGAQGRENYSLFLERMYKTFVNEIQGVILDQQSNISTIANTLYHRIEKIIEEIGYFEVPSAEAIMALQRDISAQRGKDVSMRMTNELHRMQFFVDMSKTQRYYAEEVASFLRSIIAPAKITPVSLTPIVNEPQQEAITYQPSLPETEPQEKYVYGLKGLQKLLGCGKNKAQEMVKDEKYKEAIHRDGRKYIIDSEKLLELMKLSNKPTERRPHKKTPKNRP
jgi:hypothetical protein